MKCLKIDSSKILTVETSVEDEINCSPHSDQKAAAEKEPKGGGGEGKSVN